MQCVNGEQKETLDRLTFFTKSENINNVKSAGLCTGCGTCAGICPKSAVEMVVNHEGVYVPRVDKVRCTACGKCISACPGYSVNFKGLNTEVFGSEPNDPLIGNYLNCYLGYTTNDEVRYDSASGGLVTQLVTFALQKGIVDGALVTKMNDDHPLRPHPFIARTPREVIEASKSKYCPVPLNSLLKEIREAKLDERLAIVGLPCHIHGVRKAEMNDVSLRERVVLHVGLICGHTPTFLATEFILRQVGIDKEDVSRLDYRGKGWPGGMTITRKDGNQIFVPYYAPIYWGVAFNLFFHPSRCTLCGDKLCELADISIGDAWLPELKSDNLGTSLIITRSKRGEAILHSALEAGVIKLKRVSVDAVLRSQSVNAVKRRLRARLRLFTLLNRHVPCIDQWLPTAHFSDHLLSTVLHVLNYAFSRPRRWGFIEFCTKLISPIIEHYRQNLRRRVT